LVERHGLREQPASGIRSELPPSAIGQFAHSQGNLARSHELREQLRSERVSRCSGKIDGSARQGIVCSLIERLAVVDEEPVQLIPQRIYVTLRRRIDFARNVRSDEGRVTFTTKQVVAVEKEAQINEHRDARISAAQMKSPWFGDL
jgi:hypothetical protein